MLTSNASNSKLLGKNILQSVGDFLEFESALKMKETSKQWNSVKTYENIFPNESEVAVLRNVKTEEIIWKTIRFKQLWFWETKIPGQEILMLHLRRNDTEKWNAVFLWLKEHRSDLQKNESKNKVFLKELMLAIAENVDIKISRYGYSPLMLAVEIDDKDSISTLIKRGADVNQQSSFIGLTALHEAAFNGNIDVCATLIDNNANINAADYRGETPLMRAAKFHEKDFYEFLIKKGADETLRNDDGKTASQLAKFEQK